MTGLTARSSQGPTPRLAALTWTPYALPFVVPFQTAQERFEIRRGFLVRSEDETGHVGFGEAAPLKGFGLESQAECVRALELWGPRLIGKTLIPSGVDPLPEALRELDALRGAPTARHALEGTVADLGAQSRGVPLHRWLLELAELVPGAAFPERIPVNATLGALDPDAAAARALELVRDGFTTLKIKVGVGSLEADRDRLRAVRSAVPTSAVLRVDANGAWEEATALRWLTHQADLGLEYCEQPVAPGNLEAQRRLAMASPVPIAADESVASEVDAYAVLDAGAAQILILKPMALGVLATVRVAQRAAARHIPVVVTTMLEGAFGRAAAVHTAAAVQALYAHPLPAMGLATGNLLAADLVGQPDRVADGTFRVPQGAGLGLGLPSELP